MSAKRQNVLQGAAILTAAALINKVIGLLYRVPLGNLLGATGLSCYNAAYSIFTPIYALSVSGLPVAVSKLVSEAAARRQWADVRRIHHVSRRLFLLLGLLGSVLLLLMAGPLAGWIGNPEASSAIAVMGPSIFFCVFASSYRGYFQGLGKMTPTALSQMLEETIKLVCGLTCARWVLHQGLEEYAAYGTVQGIYAASAAQAELLLLPRAAGGAMLGVTVSTVAGALFLILRLALGGDGIQREELAQSPAPQASSQLGKRLLIMALPICLASVFSHLTNLIDLAILPNRLAVALQRDSEMVISLYAHGAPAEALAVERLPTFLYGLLSYVTPLSNLVPAMTAALGISVLPSIAARWALGERERVGEQCASVIKLAGLFALPAGLGLAALADPILRLLYYTRPQEAALAAPVLQGMGIAAALAGITVPIFSLFQAVNRSDIPLKLMGAGGLVKLSVTYAMTASPFWNLLGGPVGTILCYGVILTGSSIFLRRAVKIPISLGRILGKPLLCGILCGIGANTSYRLLSQHCPFPVATVTSIAVGALFYAILAVFLKIITKNEVLLLPNGKKVAKMLEKLSLLG